MIERVSVLATAEPSPSAAVKQRYGWRRLKGQNFHTGCFRNRLLPDRLRVPVFSWIFRGQSIY